MIRKEMSNFLQRVDAANLILEGALFLVISSDITGDDRCDEWPLLVQDIPRLM